MFQAAGFAPENWSSSPTTGSWSARSTTSWPGFSRPRQPHLTSSEIASTTSLRTCTVSCSRSLPKVASAWRSQTTDSASAGRAEAACGATEPLTSRRSGCRELAHDLPEGLDIAVNLTLRSAYQNQPHRPSWRKCVRLASWAVMDHIGRRACSAGAVRAGRSVEKQVLEPSTRSHPTRCSIEGEGRANAIRPAPPPGGIGGQDAGRYRCDET